MTPPGISKAHVSQCSRNSGALSQEYKSTRRKTLGSLAVVAIALTGCSASTGQPQLSCELKTAQICSSAAEAQLHDGTLTVGYSSRPDDAQVVPFVVPVFRQDGVLAAEVDCYANTDSRTYSLVRSDLAIPPQSEESVDFLRARHLCADEGSYTENQHPSVETASTSIKWRVLDLTR
jgi:hypothetical protein